MTAWKPKTVHGYRFEVQMREKSKEEDAACESVRTVRLLVHQEDVAWGCRYMFMQYGLRNGPVSPDRDVGQGGQIADACWSFVPVAAGSKAVGGDSRTVHSA